MTMPVWSFLIGGFVFSTFIKMLAGWVVLIVVASLTVLFLLSVPIIRHVNLPRYGKFYSLLPDVVNFVHFVHANKRTPDLAFISRDGYYLDQISKRLYPEVPTHYVFSSRKAYNTGSPGYRAYAARFLNATWVDVHGTNKSHVDFFKTHFGRVPHKILMLLRSHECFVNVCPPLQWKANDYLKNLQVYATYASDDPAALPLTDSRGQLQRGAEEVRAAFGSSALEYFLRAPHLSVVDVDTEGSPVYDDKEKSDSIFEVKHDVYMDRLPDDFAALIGLLRPGTHLFGDRPLLNSPVGRFRKSSVGVLGVEVPGRQSLGAVRALVGEAQRAGFVVVIITAREHPLRVDLDTMGLGAGADVYFNPSGKEIPEVKARQLRDAHLRAGLGSLETHKSVLVDSSHSNVEAAREAGFRGVVASCSSSLRKKIEEIVLP